MSVAGTVVSPAQQSTGSTANITSLLTLTAGNLEVTTVSLIQPKLTLTSLNGAAATITVKIRDITNGRTVYRESFAKDVAADTGLVVMLPPFLSEATTYGIQVLSSNSSDTAVSWQIDWLDVGIINANTTKIGGTTQTAGRDLGTVLPNAAAGATSGLPVLDANANLLAYLRGLSPNGVDTAIGAEGAAGRLAANLLAFFNSATQNLTGASVNQTADCNAVATWQRHARVANDCVGTVWYVATAANGGNDSSDGLTPWTPKLSPKTTIEAATAGDLVLLGPGTFALGNSGIAEPSGVTVRGAGMDVTTITSTVASTTAIFKPGTNGKLSDLTIYGINVDWSYQRPLGIAAGQTAYTNAVGERLHIIAYSDGYYATGDSATSMYMSDCWIETKYDCVNCYSANQTLVIRNSVLSAIGPFGASPDLNYARAIVANNGGIVLAYDCKLRAQDGGSLSGVAVVYCGLSSSKVELYNCDLLGSNVTQSGPVYSLRTTSSAGSLLLVSGCEYDKTATTGTGITDVGRIVVDSSGAAYADERKILGTALTEGASGRLAAAAIKYGDVASPVFTAASVNQTADCNAAATWQRHARVINNCVGTVWYIAVSANGGNDSNDGLTPWTPKLTPKTVIEAATAGDLVLVGPGTFALGNNGITEPAGVMVIGAGMDQTVLTSTVSGSTTIFKPGTNGGITDMTIWGINTDDSYQVPLGLDLGNTPYTNAVGKRLHLIAYADGYYARNASATSMYLEDCWIETKFDCVNCYSANQTLTIHNSVLNAIGPFGIGDDQDYNYARSIVANNGGIVRAYNCQLRARDGGNIAGIAAAYCGISSSIIELYGCMLAASNTTQTGPVYSLRTESSVNSKLLASGCEYDRTIITGSGITDIPSHSVDSNGLTIQAAANAALVANNLDHFALTPTESDDMTAEVSDNTIFSRMLAGGNTSDFVSATMSMKKIAADAASVLAKFTGITLIAKWLGLLAGKTADAATLAEVNATTAGASFDNTTDSLEAIATSTLAIDNLTKAGGDGDLAEILSIVSSVSLGDGARAVTITVTDGTNSLENARVRVTSGSTSLVGDTNVSGAIVFGVDDATWSVTITKSGYSFTPTTLVVSANTSHTYAMTAVTIPASDPNFVTGYLYCYDENGDVEEDVIVQMKIVSLSGSGSGYDTATRSETSDATGLVTFTNLVPGALYSIRRGTETDWVDITISAAATDPYEMDNLFGEDS